MLASVPRMGARHVVVGGARGWLREPWRLGTSHVYRETAGLRKLCVLVSSFMSYAHGRFWSRTQDTARNLPNHRTSGRRTLYAAPMCGGSAGGRHLSLVFLYATAR